MSEPAPQFSPLVVAPRRVRIAVALIGPLLWVVGFVIAAVVAHETGAIVVGCAVAFGSFLVWAAVMIWLRRRRVADENEGEGEPDHAR